MAVGLYRQPTVPGVPSFLIPPSDHPDDEFLRCFQSDLSHRLLKCPLPNLCARYVFRAPVQCGHAAMPQCCEVLHSLADSILIINANPADARNLRCAIEKDNWDAVNGNFLYDRFLDAKR